jgi:hypothetical protein
MTKDEALKLALEALEGYRRFVTSRVGMKYTAGDAAITGIKAVLTQPEQEPVGFVVMERQPLTDEQISDMWCEVSNTDFVTGDTHVFARAIEAKLKEKKT